MNNDEYALCVRDLNRSLITATAAIAGFSSILFGFLTNMPVALAPGMGLNAYFAYQVVGFHGSGIVPYNLALTAVFIEGFIFIGLSLLGMRQWLVKVIPNSLKIATACGIGLFLSLIGLSSGIGLGAISGANSTPLEIAGCPDQYKDEFGQCTSHKMTSPTVSQFKHEVNLALTWYLVMDWTNVWRHCNRLPNDVQSQKCHDRRYLDRVNHSMAVSPLTQFWCATAHCQQARDERFLLPPRSGW